MKPSASVSTFVSSQSFTELPLARTIAIANLKGGVGKTTTTTINLGAALVERGHRVLLVDLDTQQDLFASLGARTPRPGLADVLFSILVFEKAYLSEAFAKVFGMTVAGGYGLAQAESQLSPHRDSESALKFALAPHLDLFDFVLLDCGPSMSYLTLSALMAAEEVLIPIQTEFLAWKQLPGIMSAVESIRARLNPKLKVTGFVPTMYDGRTRHALEILEQIAVQANRYGVRAFKPVPKTIRFAEAAASGRPVSQYAPASSAALAYDSLALEIERWSDLEDTCHSPTFSPQVYAPLTAAPSSSSSGRPQSAPALARSRDSLQYVTTTCDEVAIPAVTPAGV
jgi:chromosome partitioning protein